LHFEAFWSLAFVTNERDGTITDIETG